MEQSDDGLSGVVENKRQRKKKERMEEWKRSRKKSAMGLESQEGSLFLEMTQGCTREDFAWIAEWETAREAVYMYDPVSKSVSHPHS